jgi:DNA polymerase-3 subunit gamma/tau
MSYQVLARKYRPRRFEELVGQEHVQKALKNALDNDRLHHAYLFTGTRGVGKTTIARILSRCLNCERGVGSSPCGECATCREIDEGRFIDLIEVDAASRTKVEDTRELLENVQYAPTRGRYKVYLIDEVHMLSTHSFNALLKTLEEPPPHVKFLLATTDPQKLPVTILSRCLQFNLKAMTPERIVAHLQQVLGTEGIPFEVPALQALARAAQGSMRDALSLTDQAIAHGGGRLGEGEVNAMLGTVDRGYVWQLLDALAGGEPAALLAAVGAVAENAPDWNDLLAALISHLHRLALVQAVPDLLDDTAVDRERYAALARATDPADVQFWYQAALLGRRDLPWVPDPRAGVEMTLLRMLAFRPVGPGEVAAKKPEAPSAAAGGAGPAGPAAPVAAPSPVARTTAIPEAARPPATGNVVPMPVRPAPQAVPRGEPAAPVAAAPQPQGVAAPQPQGVAEPLPAGNLAALAARWEALVTGLAVAGDVLALARNVALEAVDGNRWEIVAAPGSDRLFGPAAVQALQAALRERAGSELCLDLKIRKPMGETPRQAAERRARERLADAEAALRNDANVRDLVELFGARLLPDSVKPLD